MTVQYLALQKLKSLPEIREILEHRMFQSMALYNHHGTVSCLDHSLRVAMKAYYMSRNQPGVDMISTVRAALLHDFYLYDWHTDSPGLHGFRHPYAALRNAERYFDLNDIERDAIKRHMWPLTVIPPVYRESMIVTMADKAVTWDDYMGNMHLPEMNWFKISLGRHEEERARVMNHLYKFGIH